MIFITLGSQKFQFNRLLKQIDKLIEQGVITEQVFAQTGYSDYMPQHFAFKDFLDRDEFAQHMQSCDLVITHGGTGAIIGAVKQGKKVIAVPRLAQFGEHVDDHQKQLVQAFSEMGIICACFDLNSLAEDLFKVRQTEYKTFKSNTGVVIDSISQFIGDNIQRTGSAQSEDSRNIRVLVVGNDLSVKGGISAVISQLLSHDWHSDGIDMSFIPTYIGNNRLKELFFFAKAVHRIRSVFKSKKRPDLVHIHMSYRGSFIRKQFIHRICMRAGIPDIIHMHGSEFIRWYQSCGKNRQKQIRKFLSEANYIIALGDLGKRQITEIEPASHVGVIHNSVTNPSRTEIVRWNSDSFQVLFLGVLIKRKGVGDLLDSIALLRQYNRLGSMHFDIAGTGEEETALKNRVRGLGLENIVDFPGWVSGERKKQLLRESQVLVLPSYHEGLPIAVLDAISYGLPIVATDVGDTRNAVIDGYNGFLIKPGDVTALADSLHRLN